MRSARNIWEAVFSIAPTFPYFFISGGSGVTQEAALALILEYLLSVGAVARTTGGVLTSRFWQEISLAMTDSALLPFSFPLFPQSAWRFY
jgi:hypothetical protein